jgi:steroid 5-alpha reductase family enzyme
MFETLLVNTSVFAITLLIYITIVFIFAQIYKNNGIMDIAYGPLFFVTALTTLFVVEGTSTTAFLITGLIGLWSTRLSLRIYRKNKNKPEDARYLVWREEWSKQGLGYFWLRSYAQIYLLQGAIITGVALPFIVATISAIDPNFTFNILGLFIYIIGLGYETTADAQLDAYLARKQAGLVSEPIMTTGLFRYSRRPNYFGETLVWWGMAIISLSLPYGFFALVSPLLITYIVVKVTGPMLEKIFMTKYPSEYSIYMKNTSYLIPMPAKNI